MKKIVLAVIFLANVVLFSACHRDRCPALGSVDTVKKEVKNS